MYTEIYKVQCTSILKVGENKSVKAIMVNWDWSKNYTSALIPKYAHKPNFLICPLINEFFLHRWLIFESNTRLSILKFTT
jgi:hypothetical protein